MLHRASTNSSLDVWNIDVSFQDDNRLCKEHAEYQYKLTHIDYDAKPPSNHYICLLCHQQKRKRHRVVLEKEFIEDMKEYRDRRDKQRDNLNEFCAGLKRMLGQQLAAIDRIQQDVREQLAALRKAAHDIFHETSEYCYKKLSHLSNERVNSVLSGNIAFEEMEALVERELQSWQFVHWVEDTFPRQLQQCSRTFQSITGLLLELNDHFNERISVIGALYEKESMPQLVWTQVESDIHDSNKVVRNITNPIFWSNLHKHRDVLVDGPKAIRNSVDRLCGGYPVIVSVLGEQVLDHSTACVYKWKIRLNTAKQYSGFGMCMEEKCRKQLYMSQSYETKSLGHGHYLIYAETGYISSHWNEQINNTSYGKYFPNRGIIEISYDTYTNELIFFRRKASKDLGQQWRSPRIAKLVSDQRFVCTIKEMKWSSYPDDNKCEVKHIRIRFFKSYSFRRLPFECS